MLGLLRDRQLTISKSVRALGLDRSSLSGLVDRTEKRGLVRREPNVADARSVHVTVSGEGAAAVALGSAELAQDLSALTDALSSAEASRLLALLERMLDHRGL